MNQYDYRHYQFPRTTNQAFGAFIPLRKDLSFKQSHDRPLWKEVLSIMCIIIVLLLVYGI